MPTLASQPDKFVKIASFDGYDIFTPINPAEGYHTSRYVEALNQQIYAHAGATKETLEEICNDMIARANKQLDKDTFRSDICSLANNILYRLKNPIDQHCAIRLGCVLTFAEYIHEGNIISENPDKVEVFWMAKKESLAMNNPDAYAFFLQQGITSTEAYSRQSDILNDINYFQNRDQAIASLTPEPMK